MAYRIYTDVNLADTCRDSDNIHTTELGYKNNLDDALLLANTFIKEHFFHKDTELYKNKGMNLYTATDFCSYGKTIYVEKIKID